MLESERDEERKGEDISVFEKTLSIIMIMMTIIMIWIRVIKVIIIIMTVIFNEKDLKITIMLIIKKRKIINKLIGPDL